MLNLFKNSTRKANAESGQVAIIFALALIPIFTMVGMSLDSRRTVNSKSQVQHTLDAVVLNGARSVQKGATAEEARTAMNLEVQSFLSRNTDIECQPLQTSFANSDKEITGKLDCKRNTMFGGMISPEKMLFGVESTSAWDIGALDVAFTFDISGSMATSNRLASLKSAASDAVDTLLPQNGANSDVRIALVAYDDMINAGDLFSDVTGLAKRRTYTATDKYREQRVIRREKYRKNSCRTTGRKCLTTTSDGACTKYSSGNRTCTSSWAWRDVKEYYGPVKSRQISKTIDSTCIWERYGDEKFSDAAPKQGSAKSLINNATTPIYNAATTADNKEAYVAAGYAYFPHDDTNRKQGMSTSGTNCSNIAPLALTNNRQKLKTYINNLKTRDGTAGHMGVAWSWYLIAEEWATVFPSASKPAKYDAPKTRKAIILMSDGQFTHEKFKSEQGDSDTQARALCDAIKAQGNLEIYTVAFQAPPAGKAVLEYCASTPDKAFTADDAAQLKSAYQDIAGSLSELRIKS